MFRRALGSMVFILLALTSINAQEKPHHNYGIGVNLYPALRVWGPTFNEMPGIYFTIALSERFRLEPELGYSRYSSDNPTSEEKDVETTYKVGLGQFYIIKQSESNSVFLGPRVGIIRRGLYQRSYTGDESENSAIDFFLNLCLGGEYCFSKYFSLGGEVQLGYINYGKYYTYSDDRSTLYHNALVTLRWYLN